MAELSVVPNDQVDHDMELGGGYEESSDGESADEMDVDVKPEESSDVKPTFPSLPVRVGSPDMSWLPPLPTTSDEPAYVPTAQASTSTFDFPKSSASAPTFNHLAGGTKDDELTGPSSLYAKFLTPIPFAKSQLADSFIDPADAGPLTKPVWEEPPQQSTLPSLLKAYEALKNEGSVSLAQTPMRVQVGDLLKRVICPPDFDAAPDTLVYPLPGPKMPLGMPSYSRPADAAAGEVSPDAASGGKGVLPEPRIPINPQPDGVLARLVREVRSPYLPPSFRDRMLNISPPPALLAKDGTPILYGDPVRGPDRAALEVTRGKPAPAPEEGAEEYYRYTYDPGPMGVEKWGRKLDIKTMGQERGRRIEASAVGEEVPRMPNNGKGREGGAVDRPAAAAGTNGGQNQRGDDAPVQVRLRLDRTHTTPHVDLTVRDQQGHEVSHGAGAAGPVGTAVAILEHAAVHEPGNVVVAEANVARSGGLAPSPSATLSAAHPNTAPPRISISPRPSISLASPKIRLSTSSVSPAAPTQPPPAGAPSPAYAPRSPVPAPPSATPPPAPPTPGAPPSAGGMKIRLGGSFSGTAGKRSAGAVSPSLPPESPANGDGARSHTPGSTGSGGREGSEGQGERPAKRPAMKIRLATPVVKQEP